MVLKSFLLFGCLFLMSCGTVPLDKTKPIYQFHGLVPKSAYVPREIKPLDLTKQRLTSDGYKRISKGISILLLSFVLSLAFANPITHGLATGGMAAGGYLFVSGCLTLFVALYLLLIVWLTIGLVIGTVLWARRKSIVTLYKNIRRKK